MHWLPSACLVFASWTAVGQGVSQQPDEFTLRITEELRAQDSEAAELFVQANAARERNDQAGAERLYRAVLERAPDFVHARRRLGGALLAQERRSEALRLARECCQAADSAENRSSLIVTLITATEKETPTPTELSQARDLARVLLADKQVDPELLFSAAQAAIAADDLHFLEDCVTRLRGSRLQDDARTHYFTWTVAMSLGDHARATTALEAAHRQGLPDQTYAELRAQTEAARPWPMRLLPVAVAVALGWAAVFLLLFVLGAFLSRAALRAATRAPAQQTGEFAGLERNLRRTYRVVLWLSCAFYYASVPLVLVAVVGFGGAILYGFLQLGRIPIKLVVFIAIGAAVTVWVALKSLLVAGRDEDPGERLDLTKHPRLRALLDEVAARIGTRAVDNVYLTPGTELAVTERGGMRRQLQGTSERCLILGLGVLDGLELGPFRAVLAHEYGHFYNRDTAGGSFALSVRRSLLTMAHGLARGGVAAVYNPAWLFLNGFYRVFLRISQGASRLQEVMADRWAAFAYGARDFERGLRHVVARGLHFRLTTDRDIRAAIESGRPLENLYATRSVEGTEESQLAAQIQAAIDTQPSPYDSHPAPKDRFAWVAALTTSTAIAADAEQHAWTLFEDRAELETAMTALVRRNVSAAHGVTVPG